MRRVDKSNDCNKKKKENRKGEEKPGPVVESVFRCFGAKVFVTDPAEDITAVSHRMLMQVGFRGCAAIIRGRDASNNFD